MTEEEKIFAGKLFNNQCPELKAVKMEMHRANKRYNLLDETDPARDEIIKQHLGKIGSTFHMVGPIHFNYGTHTFIGNNFFANFNFTVMDDARIFIGDNVCIGPNVSLLATNHPLIAAERMGLDANGKTTLAEFAEEIHIGDNVVIGAGSVVTRDSPDNHIAFGVPCRPIREITEKDSVRHLLLPEDAEFFKNNFCK